MSGEVQPQGGNKLELISFKRVRSFQKGSKTQYFISTRTEGRNYMVFFFFFFWHHFLNKLSFCHLFHMSSESCHCLTAPYSDSNTPSSPNSVMRRASQMISFKVLLILSAAPTSVCPQTWTERPRTQVFPQQLQNFAHPDLA